MSIYIHAPQSDIYLMARAGSASYNNNYITDVKLRFTVGIFITWLLSSVPDYTIISALIYDNNTRPLTTPPPPPGSVAVSTCLTWSDDAHFGHALSGALGPQLEVCRLADPDSLVLETTPSGLDTARVTRCGTWGQGR